MAKNGMDDERIADLVKADIDARVALGIKKYGGPLVKWSRNNGKSPIRNAYEEMLDLVQYLRQELEESGE